MLSKSILHKIAVVTAQVPSLVKNDNAPQAGFNYVSIDTYYEKVAKLAYETGLAWIIREEEIELFPDPDFGLLQRQTYEVDLYDTETGDGQPGAIRMSIVHPFQDAQTTGSSVSYLDKLVMRQLFKVVTGEKDADFYARGRKAQGKSNAQTKPAPSTPPSPPKEEAQKDVKKTEVVDTIEETFDTAGQENPDSDGKEGPNADDIVAAFEGAKNAAELSQARLLHDEGVRQLKKLALNSNDYADKLIKVQEVYKTQYNKYNK